ncbi:MAG TPA: hypothetical protein VF767_08015 [Bryobacteraceae bacterium]
MPRGKSTVPNQELLSAALLGLEGQKKKIEELIREVHGMLGRRPAKAAQTEAAPAKTTSRRRKLSSAARKRIAAAQKRRWAEYRKREGQKE